MSSYSSLRMYMVEKVVREARMEPRSVGMGKLWMGKKKGRVLQRPVTSRGSMYDQAK